MKLINIEKAGKFIISKELKKEIDFLHLNVGNCEWDGILIYSTDNPVTGKMKELQFTGKHVFPMGIGNAASAEFNYDSSVVDMYNEISDAIEMNMGLIHSHHNMSTFFSTTDTNDLKENCKHYNYYISLIVCFDGKYSCKIAFPSKAVSNSLYTIKGSEGEDINLKKEEVEDIAIVADLDVEFEESSLEPWFTKRFETIKKCRASSTQLELQLDKEVGNIYNNTSISCNKAEVFLKCLLAEEILENEELSCFSIEELLRTIDNDVIEDIPVNIDWIHNNVYNTFSWKDIKLHINDVIGILGKSFNRKSDKIINKLKNYLRDNDTAQY